MPTPSHLPAALTADPPIPDVDLEELAGALHALAESGGSDMATMAEAVIAGGVGAGVPEIASGYRLPDLGAAEWAMRVLREAHERLADLQAQADQWKREVDAWVEGEAKRPAATAAYMAGLLEDYTRRRRAEDPTVKTVRLLTGTVETTARKAAVKVTDPDALVAWCRENAPTAVEVVPEQYRVPAAAVKHLGTIVEDRVQEDEDGPVATVRSFVTAGGEAVPGVTVEAPRVDVRVKPA